MNKKLVTTIGILAVLAIGLYGAYRVYNHFKRLSAPIASVVKVTGTSTTPISSLKDLISKGMAATCTYSQNGSSGTVYASGGKARVDADILVNGKSEKSHVIVADGTSYIWMDGSTTGFKTTFDVNATPAPQASGATSNTFDASANMNYSCSIWTADGSMFTVPTNVQFTSFTPSGSARQCSYCASLTGDSKTQCLSALKCK